ncbi:MAG: bifunctional DNA-formamidopyrimidine glycosylase/DNA-(apurinic or apyrimidinic site) lyase [Rhodocyclaceae bacterium]|jgi:formamidopyrimidine-DNA glycosylase|nr:bifunctional DNA-formamidopyrimidine glycosylase/DNA-(apurinic or apyrimidinic site) lyase [Rhodocyclaceae bacterium]MCE2980406.1 bifunctional DNA-formamidopyrimidine glycosylase/DNA-(apurinic or apyrimidinic site) lyase [Betaproteobacteria bacterium]MCA3075968.1 bifunctional DNA-formamidopyrimidine glycosylase/DNA-(apurinic or apyrimidinic site) lyase [Rhodocyclaceae bacterium]MCA3091953.1 bifunctional DNA-formamidopyrimidine glycosylase/DNA-(apurinic or apyrimidinic site) lyase [Rhodocyclac
MPELPEVETTRRGLAVRTVGQRIERAVVRNRSLRWPVTDGMEAAVAGARIDAIDRRAKYLLFDCEGRGRLLVHLGMSGRLWVVPRDEPLAKHDHVDLELSNGLSIRLRDPRRFGAVLWLPAGAPEHMLLSAIGPEPLTDAFDAAYLYRVTRNRSAAIKLVLMEGGVVAGVGNIYANEALFAAGINPRTPARRVGLPRLGRLVSEVRTILARAIEAGGSSLRDYVDSSGQAGHFQDTFRVYDRDGKPCTACGSPVRLIRQGNRSTFYCVKCQR